MIRKILRRLFPPRRPVDVLIQRRAVRVMNRKPEHAAAYVRVHEILARGRG